jgi:hypothetical protein
MKDQKPFVVFYSWQSELPEEDNCRAIRSALRLASVEIEAKANDRKVIVDEATRELPGSPNIPQAVLRVTGKGIVLLGTQMWSSNSALRSRRLAGTES